MFNSHHCISPVTLKLEQKAVGTQILLQVWIRAATTSHHWLRGPWSSPNWRRNKKLLRQQRRECLTLKESVCLCALLRNSLQCWCLRSRMLNFHSCLKLKRSCCRKRISQCNSRIPWVLHNRWYIWHEFASCQNWLGWDHLLLPVDKTSKSSFCQQKYCCFLFQHVQFPNAWLLLNHWRT